MTALYTPTDVDAAYDAWGAACGPAALAAILRVNVDTLRPHLGSKRWTNPSDIHRALHALRKPFTAKSPDANGHAELPGLGLAFLQFGGPWLKPGVPVGAAYRNTHWIAVSGTFVYDINAGPDANGAWMFYSDWDRELMPRLLAEVKRGDGSWYVRHALEIAPFAVGPER